MKIFHYDPTTNIYLSSDEADKSPLEEGVYLIPAFATDIEPPALQENEVALWTENGWRVVEREIAVNTQPLLEADVQGLLLAKIENDVVLKYPYTYDDILEDYPAGLTVGQFNSYAGIKFVIVQRVIPEGYDDLNFERVEVNPTNIGGIWFQSYELVELDEDQKTERYNKRVNWPAFCAGLLANPAFERIKSVASSSLSVNTACTHAVFVLSLAAQGFTDAAQVQSAIDELFYLMNEQFPLTTDEKEGLALLLSSCYLDRLIVLNW